MLLLPALLWTVIGLYCLLVPRRYMLFGERWQLRNGDKAEASDTYVVVTRAGGVIFLVAAVAFFIWHFTSQTQSQDRQSIWIAWDLQKVASDEVRVVTDPEVEQVDDVAAAMEQLGGLDVGLPTWRTAVVGEDEIGNLGVSLADGDLLLAAIAGSCEPGRLLVDETAESVTVALVGVTKGMPGVGSNVVPCFTPGFRTPRPRQVIIVEVPLQAPLGDREVITVPAPDRDDFGVPVP